MILHEVHTRKSLDLDDSWDKCDCSYCEGKNKLHFGLNIPQDKSWNSWYIIKYWKSRYIRFTIPFLKRFQ